MVSLHYEPAGTASQGGETKDKSSGGVLQERDGRKTLVLGFEPLRRGMGSVKAQGVYGNTDGRLSCCPDTVSGMLCFPIGSYFI